MSDPDGPLSNLGDADLVRRIDDLVEEEHRLERQHTGESLDESGRRRLGDLEIQLDQAWDLLRRRRARRHAGLDPDGTGVRDAETVEHYQQ